MNMSTVMTRVKMGLLGLLSTAMPIDDPENAVKEIIENITLPVFSIYYPCKDKITVCLNDLELLEKKDESSIYLLPDFKTRQLLYVLDMKYSDNDTTSLSYYAGVSPLMSGPSIKQIMLGNLATQAANYFVPAPTFHFYPPRKIEVFHAYASANMMFELGFSHDKSLASIPQTASESFIKLAMLDVKANLYPTLKYYADNDTAYGHISLKIEGWENAESERDELLKTWDETYQMDTGKPFYWR